MFHAALVLAFTLIGMRVVALIPLSALAGLLLVVAHRMEDWRELGGVLRGQGASAVTTVATFSVVLVWGLGIGILAGSAIFAA